MNRKLIQLKLTLQSVPTWQVYIAFLLTYFILLYCVEELVYFDPKHFTGGNDKSVETYRRVFKFIYAALPILLFVKFKVFQLFVKFSIPKAHRQDELTKGYLFKLLITGSFVLLIPWVIKLFWFLGINKEYSMEQADGFVFLSAYHLVHTYISTEAYDYFLKLLNPFTLLFLVYIAWGISIITRQHLGKNILHVLKGYGIPVVIYASIKIYINVFVLNI